LDTTYFSFDQHNKRYKLKADLIFDSNSDDIETIPIDKRNEALQAGQELYEQMSELIYNNSDVFYLLIIEGNTQRTNNNWIHSPDAGYKLSYRRSLALYNFWRNNKVDFRKLEPNCEIILSGSGYFGLSRDQIEELNRKFTIQITAKWKLDD
jgi:hypothetical protein